MQKRAGGFGGGRKQRVFGHIFPLRRTVPAAVFVQYSIPTVRNQPRFWGFAREISAGIMPRQKKIRGPLHRRKTLWTTCPPEKAAASPTRQQKVRELVHRRKTRRAACPPEKAAASAALHQKSRGPQLKSTAFSKESAAACPPSSRYSISSCTPSPL